MHAQQAIVLEAMEAFEEVGVSGGASAQHVVLEQRPPAAVQLRRIAPSLHQAH